MTQKRRPKKPASEDSGNLRVLEKEEYENIRKKPKTVEIHLAPSLFPKHKITTNALTKFIASKAPKSGSYNAVFHFRSNLISELTDQLEKAWSIMSNTDGVWFVMPHDKNRAAVRKRVREIVPKGSVKTSDIDKALSMLSRKGT